MPLTPPIKQPVVDEVPIEYEDITDDEADDAVSKAVDSPHFLLSQHFECDGSCSDTNSCVENRSSTSSSSCTISYDETNDELLAVMYKCLDARCTDYLFDPRDVMLHLVHYHRVPNNPHTFPRFYREVHLDQNYLNKCFRMRFMTIEKDGQHCLKCGFKWNNRQIEQNQEKMNVCEDCVRFATINCRLVMESDSTEQTNILSSTSMVNQPPSNSTPVNLVPVQSRPSVIRFSSKLTDESSNISRTNGDTSATPVVPNPSSTQVFSEPINSLVNMVSKQSSVQQAAQNGSQNSSSSYLRMRNPLLDSILSSKRTATTTKPIKRLQPAVSSINVYQSSKKGQLPKIDKLTKDSPFANANPMAQAGQLHKDRQCTNTNQLALPSQLPNMIQLPKGHSFAHANLMAQGGQLHKDRQCTSTNQLPLPSQLSKDRPFAIANLIVEAGRLNKDLQCTNTNQLVQSMQLPKNRQFANANLMAQSGQFSKNGQCINANQLPQPVQLLNRLTKSRPFANNTKLVQGVQLPKFEEIAKYRPFSKANQVKKADQLQKAVQVTKGDQFSNTNQMPQPNQISNTIQLPKDYTFANANPMAQAGQVTKDRQFANTNQLQNINQMTKDCPFTNCYQLPQADQLTKDANSIQMPQPNQMLNMIQLPKDCLFANTNPMAQAGQLAKDCQFANTNQFLKHVQLPNMNQLNKDCSSTKAYQLPHTGQLLKVEQLIKNSPFVNACQLHQTCQLTQTTNPQLHNAQPTTFDQNPKPVALPYHKDCLCVHCFKAKLAEALSHKNWYTRVQQLEAIRRMQFARLAALNDWPKSPESDSDSIIDVVN